MQQLNVYLWRALFCCFVQSVLKALEAHAIREENAQNYARVKSLQILINDWICGSFTETLNHHFLMFLRNPINFHSVQVLVVIEAVCLLFYVFISTLVSLCSAHKIGGAAMVLMVIRERRLNNAQSKTIFLLFSRCYQQP